MGSKRVRTVPRLAARPRGAHKGDFGCVLVVGGSRGMIGAPALAGHAALRSGCGLARIAVPESVQRAVAVLAPCATTQALPETREGRIAAEAALGLIAEAWNAWADVIALGPGMDRSADGVRLVREVVRRSRVPVVLDADGLNNLAASPRALLARRPSPLVLTPHAGEMSRLLGAVKLALDANKQRQAAAERLAARVGAVVVLKGAGTIVTDGRRTYVNRTGNPGMATGGTGDVLTGVIAALIAQGLAPFDAAVLGTFVHGRAGDLAARKLGEMSLIASDLLDCLPAAFLARRRAAGPARRARKR